ncbi:GAP family protein [Geodermatophilus amargosae]|uniref:GAP family protein n=1 Tax=Geodermatophilus amargosae TaxID=1296565 RepID=UPI0034E04631
MTSTLLAGIAGLAALDSLNPATIAGVALILLAPLQRRLATALAYVAGAYLTVLAIGVAVYAGADLAADLVTDGLVWVRRGAFGLAALLLLVAAVRRLRPQQRSAVVLPRWFGPWTAAPVGVLVTAADLPNAFPYVIAIERLVTADVPLATGLWVLAGYAVVYCLPCLVLLAAGTLHGERVRRRLHRVYDRIGQARTVPGSMPAALGLVLLGAAVATIAAQV